jgi:3-isopropylmalate/(R)-2-methylmalate dehydratase small subunit
VHGRVIAARRADPRARLTVDLPAQTLSLGDAPIATFDIDPFAKECLVHGIDELGYLLDRVGDIERYEASHP